MLSSRHPAFKYNIFSHRQSLKTNILKRNPEDLDQYSDYLEVHRRNIILDFKKKVEEIKTMRQKLSTSIPQRKTTYLKYKTQRSQTKRKIISQKVIEQNFAQNHEDKKLSVNTLNFNGISLRDSQLQRIQDKILTPFQKYLQNKMKVKKQLIQKKKSIKFVQGEKTPQKPNRFRNSFVHNFRIFTE